MINYFEPFFYLFGILGIFIAFSYNCYKYQYDNIFISDSRSSHLVISIGLMLLIPIIVIILLFVIHFFYDIVKHNVICSTTLLHTFLNIIYYVIIFVFFLYFIRISKAFEESTANEVYYEASNNFNLLRYIVYSNIILLCVYPIYVIYVIEYKELLSLIPQLLIEVNNISITIKLQIYFFIILILLHICIITYIVQSYYIYNSIINTDEIIFTFQDGKKMNGFIIKETDNSVIILSPKLIAINKSIIAFQEPTGTKLKAFIH